MVAVVLSPVFFVLDITDDEQKRSKYVVKHS